VNRNGLQLVGSYRVDLFLFLLCDVYDPLMMIEQNGKIYYLPGRIGKSWFIGILYSR